MAAGKLSRLLQYALIVSVLVEFLAPKAPWSLWALVSFPVISFLLSSSAVYLMNADFLTNCDVFILGPAATVQINLLSITAIVFMSLKRMRL